MPTSPQLLSLFYRLSNYAGRDRKNHRDTFKQEIQGKAAEVYLAMVIFLSGGLPPQGDTLFHQGLLSRIFSSSGGELVRHRLRFQRISESPKNSFSI
jgi:hypothetical protein